MKPLLHPSSILMLAAVALVVGDNYLGRLTTTNLAG